MEYPTTPVIQRRAEALVASDTQSINLTFRGQAVNIIGNNDECATNLTHVTSAGVVLSIQLPSSLDFPGVIISNVDAHKATDEDREAIKDDVGDNSSYNREYTSTKDAGVMANMDPGVADTTIDSIG